MKTFELTGAELDCWVARAEGLPLCSEAMQSEFVLVGTGAGDLRRYSPSAYWAHGGPIIERERIWLSDEDEGQWLASLPPHVDVDNGRDLIQFGPTPLVAAMRAYVARKFGEEVPEAGA